MRGSASFLQFHLVGFVAQQVGLAQVTVVFVCLISQPSQLPGRVSEPIKVDRGSSGRLPRNRGNS